MASAFSFVRELRRRKVFRGAALYLVGAWFVLQVGDAIAESAGLPSWTMTVLLYIAVIGFPFAVFLGWRYEITDDGLARTAPVEANDNVELSLKASDYVLIAVFISIAAFAGYQLIPQVIEEAEESVTIGGDAVVHRNSIAVLPFQDYSPGGDHTYLSDGLADNVTYVLGQIDGLIATARTSTQSFRNATSDAPEINDWTSWPARLLAQTYVETGEREKGLALLDALEAAIDSGWMFFSYGLARDPSFDAWKDDERFLAIVQKLADRMADERAWYQEHKGDRLY